MKAYRVKVLMASITVFNLFIFPSNKRKVRGNRQYISNNDMSSDSNCTYQIIFSKWQLSDYIYHFNPQDALKYHFTSMKTGLILIELRILE